MKITFLNTYSFDSLQVSFQQGVQGEDDIVAQTLELEERKQRWERSKEKEHRDSKAAHAGGALPTPRAWARGSAHFTCALGASPAPLQGAPGPVV